MRLETIITQRIRHNVFLIITGTAFVFLMLSLLFYSLFLLLPAQFIKAGLISPYGLIISYFILLIMSICINFSRRTFFGNRFYKSIIEHRYSANDLKAAIELENGESYPGRKPEITKRKGPGEILSNNYISKIIKNIKPCEKLIKVIFPDFRRITACILIILFSLILTFFKIELIADVFTALKSGLPAELIAVNKSIKFEKLEAIIIPPAYLDLNDATSVDLSKTSTIKVIQGSSVLVKGTVEKRRLKSGKLVLSAGSGVEYFPITATDSINFEVTFLAPTKGAFALEINFINVDEKEVSGKSKIFTIEALPDQPPSIKIFFPPEIHNLVYGSSVEISFSASDDYGILEILLYHKDSDKTGEYYKELIARFHKEPKTTYSSTYTWNPVLREGDKVNELVYPPTIKTVEYFLEVRDINSFSASGIGRSSIRKINFTDVLADLKTAIDIIHELITDGQKLLSNNDNQDLNIYKKKLGHAIDHFTKELKDTLPQSNLIQRTGEMISSLTIDKLQERNKSLKSYIEYLERFIVFMDLLLKSETAERVEKEFSGIDTNKGDVGSILKKFSSLADILEKEFSKEIAEIKKLMKSGETDKAQAKISELIQKIRKKLFEEYAKSRELSKKIADEVKTKLEEMTKQARELLKAQELNKVATDSKKQEKAAAAQAEINKRLLKLTGKTEKLSFEYPFIMSTLNAYAGAAKQNGTKALESLLLSDHVKSSNYQGQVIRHLKRFLDASSQQIELMEELVKGNFDRLLSRGLSGRFVLIPKEAAYTIPIDYKTKIIEMSKDRSNTTKEKEDFWRDILE
jgi:hypothetical protein